MNGKNKQTADPASVSATTGGADLLSELVAHLQRNRTQLREEWARRIQDTRLLTAMSKEEIFSEATSVYDNYVEVLETGSVEALQAYARNLSERIIPRGVETHEVKENRNAEPTNGREAVYHAHARHGRCLCPTTGRPANQPAEL